MRAAPPAPARGFPQPPCRAGRQSTCPPCPAQPSPARPQAPLRCPGMPRYEPAPPCSCPRPVSCKPAPCCGARCEQTSMKHGSNQERLKNIVVSHTSFWLQPVARAEWSLAPLRLHCVPEQRGNIRSTEALYLATAGWGGHVDLRHPVADHLDADGDEAALPQGRADSGADFPLALRQFRFFRATSDMHIGARFRLGRYAVDGANRLSVDQYDALVALAHVLQVALHDERLAKELREHFKQRTEIAIRFGEMEDTGAAIAVERLHDDVAVLAAKGHDLRDILGDQGFRHQVGEFGDEDLFRTVAHPCRIVH